MPEFHIPIKETVMYNSIQFLYELLLFYNMKYDTIQINDYFKNLSNNNNNILLSIIQNCISPHVFSIKIQTSNATPEYMTLLVYLIYYFVILLLKID